MTWRRHQRKQISQYRKANSCSHGLFGGHSYISLVTQEACLNLAK